MRDPADFDALYEETRARLLVQTFALTGDLEAARVAVERAFSAAWQRWRRVSASGDAEGWVRRHAWRRVARRSRRPSSASREELGEELADTLTALDGLPDRQRRLLVLDQSTRLPLADIAREVGLSPEAAERELEQARERVRSGAGSVAVPLEERRIGFARAVAGTAWTPAESLRRAGTGRRRRRRLLVAAVILLALVGGAVAVVQLGGSEPGLAAGGRTGASGAVRIREPAPPPAQLLGEDLLTAEQVGRLDRSRRWRAGRTTDNTGTDGLLVACQRSRFADPRGIAALVRGFRARGEGVRLAGVQLSELSRTRRAARAAYREALAWYAACDEPRTQLLSTHEVRGVGTAAALFVVRSTEAPVTTTTVGLARTGRTVTTVARTTADTAEPAVAPAASLLAAAVNGLCGSPGAARCAGPPDLVEAAPLPIGPVSGMLAEVDLPPVSGVDAAWVGTRPERARVNVATTRCDQTEFTGGGITRAFTRSFLVTDAELPQEFGLTQTVGLFPDRAAAGVFVDQVRADLASCEEGDLGLGTQVEPLSAETTEVPPAPGPAPPASGLGPEPENGTGTGPGDSTQVAMWEVIAEVSDERSVRFLMAILRSGRAVSQVGFVPVEGADIGTAAFAELVDRALARLPSYAARTPAVD